MKGQGKVGVGKGLGQGHFLSTNYTNYTNYMNECRGRGVFLGGLVMGLLFSAGAGGNLAHGKTGWGGFVQGQGHFNPRIYANLREKTKVGFGKNLFLLFTVVCLLLFAAPIVSAEKTWNFNNHMDKSVSFCGVPVSGLGVRFAGGVESLIPGCAQSFALLGVGQVGFEVVGGRLYE